MLKLRYLYYRIFIHSLAHRSQLLPHLDHSVGVQAAVFKEGLTIVGAIFRRHEFHLREDIHGIATILHSTREVVIVERRIIREQCRKDFLDRERTIHGRYIVIAGTERIDQVNDVLRDIAQMIGQIRIGISELIQTATLKVLVISGGADIERDILAYLFCQSTTRISTRLSKEGCMVQLATLSFDPVQRILEGNLLIGLRAFVLWQ